MGQFIDYLASVFTTRVEPKPKTNNHVTFSDASLSNATSRNDSDKPNSSFISQSNKKTIHIYQSIGAMSFLAQLGMVFVPKFQLESFDPLETEFWQFVTLSLVPLIVYMASIGAMNEINQPISEGTKLTSKNSGLNLNNNDFIHSLKIIILLMSMCQIAAIFSDKLIWSVVLVVSLWCYILTSRVAQSEYKRFAPSPKKQWVKLNISRSPKTSTPNKTPNKQASVVKQDATQVRATPRTRTKRAVKNIITGVTDKYHAFEQNVAHQLSQKIFTPLSPKIKMLE